MTMLLVCLTLFASDNPYDSGPPSSPQESLAQIRVPSDIVVELVAAEPLVVDPVAMAFDEKGQLFVAEYRDYPTGPADPNAPPLSRIRRLLDKDGDGRMDEANIFADELPSAQGLACWKGGLIVTAANTIFWIIDRDGDGKADERQVLFEGLGRHNTQLQPAHPRLGLDNWFYVTNGLAGGKIHRPNDKLNVVDIGANDFRFDPLGGEFEPATGLGQFGNTFDAVGNRFSSSNRNPIIHEVIPYRSLHRNPYASLPLGYHDAAPSGADSRVYPIVDTATTAYSHTGTHTAACGVHVNQGDLLGDDANGLVFVCDPTGHLVTCNRLIPDGVTFRSERILQTTPTKADWLVSSDKWFRPVSLANGPDGALYLCDMYRAVIEHPVYMPPGVAEKVPNLRAGDDKGRIYRLRKKGLTPRPYKQPQTADEQVAMLGDPNGWRRMTIHRLFLAQTSEDRSLAPSALLKTSQNPLVRLHALSISDGLRELREDQLLSALKDVDARIQERALVIVADRSLNSQPIQSAVLELMNSPEPRVRFRAILALSDDKTLPQVTAIVKRILADGNAPWLWAAIKCVLKNNAVDVFDQLLATSRIAEKFDASVASHAAEIAGMVSARGKPDEFQSIVRKITDLAKQSPTLSLSLLAGLAEGMTRNRSHFIPKNLTELVEQPGTDWKVEADILRPILITAVERTRDQSLSLVDRLTALRLLPFLSGPDVVTCLISCLDLKEPIEIQSAAIDAIRQRGDEKLLIELIARWDRLANDTKQAAVALLLQRGSTTLALLKAIDEGRIPAGTIGVDQRAILLASGSAPIKKQAERLFGGAVSKDRKGILDQYAAAITSKGDIERGHTTYKRVCANCHRIGSEGIAVGPDIGDVRNKTPEQLMADIIDPNRIVEPRYAGYSILLNDGRSLTGRVVRETPDTLVLLQAGGIEQVVPRDEIDSVASTGTSLMTVGIEKDVSVQEMADLIAFLKSGR